MGVGSVLSIYMLVLAYYACDATATNTKLISPKSQGSTHALSLIARSDYRNDAPDFEQIVKLIRGMRADGLLRHAGPLLEIVLGERESTCTNRAAYAMIRNFFEKHPIRNFKVLHQGGGQSAYLMGLYMDQSGDSFKVRIFFGVHEGKWEITRLVFR
ncbi:MAG: DUF4783 domain-containing protein [Sphingomonadales bacterium]|nr:DUF4783 domain-containing protein [Sphingomonadales bacterium]MBM3923796.1 DUF4783 domain-containing protein [Sphingomonadales bacterium]